MSTEINTCCGPPSELDGRDQPEVLDAEQFATYAKALGHPARVAILQILLKKDGCMCGEIVEELPLAQSTVSQHLKQLKAAGLIRGEVDGPRVCYCIEPAAIAHFKALTQLLK